MKPSGTTVEFGDPTGTYILSTNVVTNPEGAISADKIATVTLSAIKASLANPQTENMPPTTTVGGESWVQKSISGMTTKFTINGKKTDGQAVVICDNHPANSPNTKNFGIFYITIKDLFATAVTTYFQPMLNSFKFTN